MDCHRYKLIRFKEFKTQLQGLFLSNLSFAIKHQPYLSFTGFPSSTTLSFLYGHRRMKKIVNKNASAANGYANDLKIKRGEGLRVDDLVVK